MFPLLIFCDFLCLFVAISLLERAEDFPCYNPVTFRVLEKTMAEWTFAQTQPSDELAQLHFYSINEREGDRTIEFRITVREYATPNHLNMRFFAEADKHTNQKTAPYTPCGWGQTLLQALADCVKAIHRFPYEGE